MSETRTKTVKQAYDALDVTGKGVITLRDLQGKYSVKTHPLYKNGEMTEEQIFMRFLTKFQTGSTHIDQVLTFSYVKVRNCLPAVRSACSYKHFQI